jgi:hypothetical protein
MKYQIEKEICETHENTVKQNHLQLATATPFLVPQVTCTHNKTKQKGTACTYNIKEYIWNNAKERIDVAKSKKNHPLTRIQKLSIYRLYTLDRFHTTKKQRGKRREQGKIINLCTNERSDWCQITGIILVSSRNLIKWPTTASTTRYGKAYFLSNRSLIK